MSEFHANEKNVVAAQPAQSYPRIQPLGFAVIALIGIFILYQLIGGALTVIFFGSSVTQSNVNVMRWSTFAAQLLFLLLPTLFLMRWQNGSIASVLGTRKPKASEILLAVIGVFSLEQFFEGYLVLQDKIPLPTTIQPFVDYVRRVIEETFRLLVHAHSTPELLVVFLIVALTPAVCEEILFRGMIQKNLTLGTTTTKGFVWTGIIFAVYHLDPFLLVPLIALGIYLGFLRVRSGTIVIPMIAHFTNNFVSVVGEHVQAQAASSPAVNFLLGAENVDLSVVVTMMIGSGLIFLLSLYVYLHVTSVEKTGTVV
ncbi:MAG: CPBP family intramembrane metalloprotease [Bacteroidota bacterium]|nr:CPBP family intramembrane metalloprotease [Bacteroidota bacterium]